MFSSHRLKVCAFGAVVCGSWWRSIAMTAQPDDSAGHDLRRLSARQREAIEGLASGMNADDVAFFVHVPPALITLWRRFDLAFRLALVARKADPRPAHIDLGASMLSGVHLAEPEQEWSADKEEESERRADPTD
jgi:hypothetical protein